MGSENVENLVHAGEQLKIQKFQDVSRKTKSNFKFLKRRDLMRND